MNRYVAFGSDPKLRRLHQSNAFLARPSLAPVDVTEAGWLERKKLCLTEISNQKWVVCCSLNCAEQK
jgi:hypothetical protein